MAINRQLLRFNSWFSEVDSEGMDCLLQDWSSENNWLAPLIMLILRILDLVERQWAMATIIAPIWLGCCWFNQLEHLSCNQLIHIPTSACSFLANLEFMLVPLHNCRWKWAAFRISGCPTQWAGLQQWPTF
jgi:hypothetical protein